MGHRCLSEVDASARLQLFKRLENTSASQQDRIEAGLRRCNDGHGPHPSPGNAGSKNSADMWFDPDQLSTMIAHAVAPAFLLGAVAAFVSILFARMTAVTERIRDLNRIADNDEARKWLKEDVARLKRRLVLLNQSLYLTLTAGIGITILLLVGFLVTLFGYRHEVGAGALFIVSLCLLVGSLFRFLQDVSISLSDHDHYR